MMEYQMHKHRIFQLVLTTALVSLAQPNSFAGEHHESRNYHHEGWRGDIHHFHEHDIAHWRAGSWRHDWHGGREGWWWIVGGVWYFYPSPVYPYPDPYLPPVAVAPQPAPTPPAPAQYWYYCPNPAGYYPYVAQCQTDWQKVPATTPPDMRR
jgi:hypothetical protein